MGGYIAGGMVEEGEAVRILEFEISQKEVDDLDAAKQTIKKGIEHGKTIPLYELEKDLVITPSSRAIKYVDNVWESMKYTFKHGKKRGDTTHFDRFDQNFKWKAGEITLIIGRPNCFTKETLIHTAVGVKQISELSVGDMVLSYDEKLKKNEYKNVVNTMINYQNETPLLKIKMKDGTIIRVTENHRFFIGGRYVEIKEILLSLPQNKKYDK
jgi:hypothetical protein